MRTTLDLPDDLLREAMTVTGIPTKTKVIVAALNGIVRKTRLAGLKDFKGKVDLDIDLDALRDRKCPY